jgi:hypothetical protein
MLNFRGFITEVAQKGFQYEVNASNVLKTLDVVPNNFRPAGAGSDQPDLLIKIPGTKNSAAVGCELKIIAASAGSLVLKYINGKWQFGNITDKDEEKIFIRDLADEIKIFDIINKNWKSEPYKGADSQKLKDEIKSLSKREIYERDLSLFKDIKGEIPATKIEDYYNKKKTYYVNVGTHGFYLLGTNNPLKFKGIPRFGTSAKATYRARVQYKGGNNYQFTFEMQFSIPAAKRSPYNIAPVKSKNSVDIDTSAIDISFMDK